MKSEMVLPDYNNSILNLITSIQKNYNVKIEYNSLEIIDKYLEKGYKNVVLVVLDGMGEEILKGNSPNGLFCKNKIDTITSVFPPTTTAAMTTYYSGKPPIETGWISWSQYFKEYGRTIDILPNIDSYTKEKFNCKNYEIENIIGYKTIYEKIEENNKDILTYEIIPSSCIHKNMKISIAINDLESMCKSIKTLCRNNDKKFVLSYYDQPDGIIHKYGCYSEETKNFIKSVENNFTKLCEELKGTNTLIIISADHGHKDINKTYNIIELEEIQECLIMPPFLEARCLSFFVKRDMDKEFVYRFNKLFKEEFKLYTKEKFLNSNLLGYGQKHKKIDDFIGDYIAVAIGDSMIRIETHISEERKEKKSTHCGMTKDEMEVPVIVLDLK